MLSIVSKEGTRYSLGAFRRVHEFFGPKSKVFKLKKLDQKSGVCFSILFVLVDVILLSVTLQKKPL